MRADRVVELLAAGRRLEDQPRARGPASAMFADGAGGGGAGEQQVAVQAGGAAAIAAAAQKFELGAAARDEDVGACGRPLRRAGTPAARVLLPATAKPLRSSRLT